MPNFHSSNVLQIGKILTGKALYRNINNPGIPAHSGLFSVLFSTNNVNLINLLQLKA